VKFLIVDKSSDVRLSIKKIINSTNKHHEVAEASNYDLAFFYLYSFSPDYVIMDPESLNGKGMMMLQSTISLLPASRVFLFMEFSENIIKNKLIESGVKKIFSKDKETQDFVHELLELLKSDIIGYESIYSEQSENPIL
jgi:DNA-binding NarL/FixJ family response regulator